MKFTNNGEPVKIRIGEINECYWVTIREGESIELSLEEGLRLGFKIKTTEGKIGNQVVETKQIDTDKNTDDFLKELQSINGIGKKTAKDLLYIFETKDRLIRMIKLDKPIPIRDDIEIKLREHYG